ncbi:hypothetical protein EJB05_11534, partial [Eragrostis curvula]
MELLILFLLLPSVAAAAPVVPPPPPPDPKVPDECFDTLSQVYRCQVRLLHLRQSRGAPRGVLRPSASDTGDTGGHLPVPHHRNRTGRNVWNNFQPISNLPAAIPLHHLCTSIAADAVYCWTRAADKRASGLASAAAGASSSSVGSSADAVGIRNRVVFSVLVQPRSV